MFGGCCRTTPKVPTLLEFAPDILTAQEYSNDEIVSRRDCSFPMTEIHVGRNYIGGMCAPRLGSGLKSRAQQRSSGADNHGVEFPKRRSGSPPVRPTISHVMRINKLPRLIQQVVVVVVVQSCQRSPPAILASVKQASMCLLIS